MNVAEEAFRVAEVHIADGGGCLPFALIAMANGRLECLTIVTDRSDKAAYLGRRLVRERAAQSNGYAIVTDAFVRRGEERLDAVFVESAVRGEDVARIVARPHASGRLSSETLDLGGRPSEIAGWDPFLLHWGGITPDLYHGERKLAVHVVNHELEAPENVRRTIRFLRARIRHHAPHLPPASTQLVHIDDRGQTVTDDTRVLLRTHFENVAFTTETRRG